MNAEPLVVTFDVAAAPAHVFETWTARCATWWPRSHTVSGDPTAIAFEPRPGGAILEHAPDGVTHRWGEILDWEPPTRLRYRWHLFFDTIPAERADRTLYLGADREGVMLEVVSVPTEDGFLIIHAMPMRPRYRSQL